MCRVKAFLSERHQFVYANNVSSGVPQGSVLGLLLFLICINDISVNLCSTAKHFDCVICRKITSNSGDGVEGSGDGVGFCGRHSPDSVAECLAPQERRHRLQAVFFFHVENVPNEYRVVLPPLPHEVVVINTGFLHCYVGGRRIFEQVSRKWACWPTRYAWGHTR